MSGFISISPWRCETCGHEDRDLRAMRDHVRNAHPAPVPVVAFPKAPRCIVCGDPIAEGGDGRCSTCREQDAQPFVCPGCHAVGTEQCLPGCIDAEIARQCEEEAESDDYDYGDEGGDE